MKNINDRSRWFNEAKIDKKITIIVAKKKYRWWIAINNRLLINCDFEDLVSKHAHMDSIEIWSQQLQSLQAQLVQLYFLPSELVQLQQVIQRRVKSSIIGSFRKNKLIPMNDFRKYSLFIVTCRKKCINSDFEKHLQLSVFLAMLAQILTYQDQGFSLTRISYAWLSSSKLLTIVSTSF